MADWKRIAADNYDDGVMLIEAKCYRSGISRLYYAVFSLLTQELVERGATSDFTNNKATPAHTLLPSLIENWFNEFTVERKANLIRHVSNLYADRLRADYTVVRVDKVATRNALQSAQVVFRYFEGT